MEDMDEWDEVEEDLDSEAPWEMAFERGAAIANDDNNWDEIED